MSKQQLISVICGFVTLPSALLGIAIPALISEKYGAGIAPFGGMYAGLFLCLGVLIIAVLLLVWLSN